MIKARKSIAHARSMMASGNPLPPEAHVSGLEDSLREAGLARIISETGELSAGKQAGQRAHRAWPAGLGRRMPGWSVRLDSAERLPSDPFAASSAKRRLVPLAAAISVAAIVVAAAVIGQQAAGRGPTTGVGSGGTSPSPTRSPRASVIATINVGWLPFGVAVDSATGTVYVANTFGSGVMEVNRGSVSVISAQTNEVTGTVKVQSAPHGVAVDPQTNTIYVTNEQANDPQGSPKHGTVSVINGGTGKVAATIGVGKDPFEVAADPQTDMVYVGNNATVSVINGHTNKVTATINVGKEIDGVAVDPVTDTIYVADYVADAVSVIDGHTNKVTTTIAVGTHPFAVAVNASAGTIYVTNSGADSVSVIDGHTNKVTATIKVGKQPLGVAVDPSNSTVYVTNATGPQKSGTVTLIDGATNTVTATVAVDETPQGVDVNPVTGLAYVANEFSKTVSVIRP